MIKIEDEKDNIDKHLLVVRLFSSDELQEIKMDCLYALNLFCLSKEQADIRKSIIDKIDQELEQSNKY